MMNVKDPIRIMIVDDHEVVRRGLASYLEGSDEFAVVASVGSGDEALRVFSRAHPDIVMMDVMMPHMDGVETTRRLKALQPNVKVVVLTAVAESESVNRMFEAGAIGYVLKNAPIDDLRDLMRTIHLGRMVFSPEVVRKLMQPQNAPSNVFDLTERELEVLRLITAGYNNPQIAEKLFISRSTAGYHVSSIIRKLGVASRIEVAIFAMKNRLITETAAVG